MEIYVDLSRKEKQTFNFMFFCQEWEIDLNPYLGGTT